MSRPHRLLTALASIVCLLGTQGASTLLAEGETAANATSTSAATPLSAGSRSIFTFDDHALTNGRFGAAQIFRDTAPFTFASDSFSADSAQYGRYHGHGGHHHGGAQAAVILGSIAAITGASLLIYANRPECSYHPYADGCGYGTKVLGGAALAGGMVGIFVGAATW